MKIWNCGKFEDVEFGRKVLVFKCGSSRTYFGEFGVIDGCTDKHLVIVTDSGAIVKTAIDNIHDVKGKARKEGYAVSLKVDGRKNDPDFILSPVWFWNEKKLILEKR